LAGTGIKKKTLINIEDSRVPDCTYTTSPIRKRARLQDAGNPASEAVMMPPAQDVPASGALARYKQPRARPIRAAMDEGVGRARLSRHCLCLPCAVSQPLRCHIHSVP